MPLWLAVEKGEAEFEASPFYLAFPFERKVARYAPDEVSRSAKTEPPRRAPMPIRRAGRRGRCPSGGL